jgi:hypothetical protein
MGSDKMDQRMNEEEDEYKEEEAVSVDDKLAPHPEKNSSRKTLSVVELQGNRDGSSQKLLDHLLHYEAIVSVTKEELMLHLARYKGAIYSVAIGGYGHIASVEQIKKIFKCKGD